MNQGDQTCTHHGCTDFGTHLVTSVPHETDQSTEEWMCPEHSQDACREFGVARVHRREVAR